MASPNKSNGTTEQRQEEARSGRMLTLLADGAAMNMPEIDKESYNSFRQAVERLSKQAPDRSSEDEKLQVVQEMVREFGVYRKVVDEQMQERLVAWRTLTNYLLHQILECLQLQPNSPSVLPLIQKMSQIERAEQVNQFLAAVKEFLYPPGRPSQIESTASLRSANLSTSNDNASGLLGGGSAVAHLEKLLAQNAKGYVVQFELGCLDVIDQRFGLEAVQDCLIAVSSFITEGLHSDDRIYHWSDSRLLAIVQGRVSEQILRAELNQLAGRNRDFMVQVGSRTIMLRIPLSFEIYPISHFTSAEDINKLPRNNSLSR